MRIYYFNSIACGRSDAIAAQFGKNKNIRFNFRRQNTRKPWTHCITLEIYHRVHMADGDNVCHAGGLGHCDSRHSCLANGIVKDG